MLLCHNESFRTSGGGSLDRCFVRTVTAACQAVTAACQHGTLPNTAHACTNTHTSSPHSKSVIANMSHVMSHVYTYEPRPISPSHLTHPLSAPPHSRQSSLNDLTGTGGPDAANGLRSRAAPHLTPANMRYFKKKIFSCPTIFLSML